MRSSAMTASRRLRIAYVIDGFAGVNFLEFLGEAARDHDVFLWALSELTDGYAEALQGAGVTVVNAAPVSRAAYPALVVRLARCLRSRRIEVVHAHLFDASLLSMAAGAIARTRVRVLTRHHGELHHQLHKPLHVLIDRLSNALAHRVIAVSAATKDFLIAAERVPPAKIRIIPNGIQVAKFRAAAHDREAARRELALTDEVVIVVPARLHEQKGHRYLLEA